MRRANLHRHAKVVATLGPASSSVEMLSDLILAGMNVARVNMSHGNYEEHAELIANIRKASGAVGLEVAILLDLQGPKIRVDSVPEGLKLKDGETWVIGPTRVQEDYPEYKDCFIPTKYEHIIDDCEDGARILFDDGLIVAQAVEKDRDVNKINILVGGILKSHKGINLPDSRVSAPSLTEKDREDIIFAIEQAVDYIALSFVRKKQDALKLKELLRELNEDIPIVSKIENREAIDNMEAILDVSDVIMVARGDMGVELGNHLVPAVQKYIISSCNHRGIPVITATQMLESMVENSTPTRAEASDVANAIWDGTDAVMLSAETASGKHPIEAVKMMGKIIREAEKTPKERPSFKFMDLTNIDDATVIGASLIAERIGAKRILSVTQSGNSCLKMCRFRPQTSVLGVSNSLPIVRRMCLYWGVSPFYLYEYDEDDSELENYVIDKVRSACDLHGGDKIVITRGSGKFFARGSSNSIKVVVIE
ncbi:MAG: pyruvate kinase [Deltaproteobacteria bacterium]|nr:pyruvate kinase [Deltaproteobacteria bacterium]